MPQPSDADAKWAHEDRPDFDGKRTIKREAFDAAPLPKLKPVIGHMEPPTFGPLTKELTIPHGVKRVILEF